MVITGLLGSVLKIILQNSIRYSQAIYESIQVKQGSTFDTALVDVNDIVYDKYHNPYTDAEDINRRLYVACSRAKNKLYLKYGLQCL